MSIFLIIIGGILVLICGFIFLATHTVLKSQDNWDEFYKSVEEKNLPTPEETVYTLVCKMNFWFCMGTVLGLILLCGGILLLTVDK